MTIEIRPATGKEMDQLGLMGSYSYAGAFGDGPDNVTATASQPDWTLCAFDGAVMATSFVTFPFTMRANGNALAMAGISAVGTRPEYRRLGLLRKIMTRSFAEQRDRGQSVAGLWASQAAIYQRYGFSMLHYNRQYRVDTVDIGFHDGLAGDLEVKRYDPSDCIDIVKGLYRTHIANRLGYLHRASVSWMLNIFTEREEDGPVYVAVAYDGDQPAGYLVYVFRSGRVENRARGQEMKIRDFVWLNDNAYRSLWTYIAKHDLVGRVVWENAPMDDPAVDLFVEPRMLNVQEDEGSWLRIVDLETALGQRGYCDDGDVSIAVEGDSLADWNNGQWRLNASDGEVEVSRTKNTPDVVMNIRTLTSLFTGMRSAKTLATWGQIKGDDAAVMKLNRLFATHHAPHCPDHY